MLQEISSVNLIVLHLIATCHHRVRTLDIIQSTLLPKHFTRFEMTEHQELLFDGVEHLRLDENVWHVWCGIEQLANASVYKVDEVTILVMLLYLVPLGCLLLLEEHFEVFHQPFGKLSKTRNISDEEVNLLLTLRYLCLWYNVDILDCVHLKDNCCLSYHLTVFISCLVVKLLLPEKGVLINTSTIFEFIISLN